MRILDALSEEERTLLVGILAEDAPDLLADMQTGPLTPGPRDRLTDVVDNRLVGEAMKTVVPGPMEIALKRLRRRLEEIQPIEPERLVYGGPWKRGDPSPAGMEQYREVDPEYGTSPVWDLVRGVWVPGRSRATWAAPPQALRPPVEATFRLDLSQPGAAGVTLRLRARHQVVLPGGAEADYYTDDAGQVVYVETEYGTPERPNPVLEAPWPSVTYLVHSSADGGRQPSHVMATDQRARLVVAYPTQARLWHLRQRGEPDPVPFGKLFGGPTCPVSPHTLLACLDGPTTDHLARWAQQLINEPFQVPGTKGFLRLRLEAVYDGTDPIPSQVTVHSWRDGHPVRTESFPTR